MISFGVGRKLAIVAASVLRSIAKAELGEGMCEAVSKRVSVVIIGSWKKMRAFTTLEIKSSQASWAKL